MEKRLLDNSMSIITLIDKNELRQCVDLINKHKIPSLPESLTQIRNEVLSPNPNIELIIQLVNKDIGLSSSILKIVNSSQYNLSVKVTSIKNAINLLGINVLKNEIIKPAYKLALEQNFEGFEDISAHSHYVGLITDIIANFVQISCGWEQCEFYLAGLFHDVGVLVLSLEYPDYLEFYYKNEFRPASMMAIEKDRYQVTHGAIGVLLAKKWGLPEEICNAIYLHHFIYGTYKQQVNYNTSTVAAMLQLAHALNDMFEHSEDEVENPENMLMYRNSISELMLDEEQLAYINAELRDL